MFSVMLLRSSCWELFFFGSTKLVRKVQISAVPGVASVMDGWLIKVGVVHQKRLVHWYIS